MHINIIWIIDTTLFQDVKYGYNALNTRVYYDVIISNIKL